MAQIVPAWLESLVLSGRLAEVAIAILVVETALIALIRRNARSLVLFLPNAISGISLLVALRAALTDAGAIAIIAALTAAFAGHILDLWIRYARQA